MARVWGPKSQRVRASLCVELQKVVDFILQEVCDISLLEGHRPEQRQNMLFSNGFSKVMWPNSKHNTTPSDAVDLQPYPWDGVNEQLLREELTYIAGRAIEWARWEGIKLRWGGDWDMDGDLGDNGFDDLFHFEVVR